MKSVTLYYRKDQDPEIVLAEYHLQHPECKWMVLVMPESEENELALKDIRHSRV